MKDKFIWYSDQYLRLRDLFNSMSTSEAIGFQAISQVPLLPVNEIPYLSGEKSSYTSQVGFFIGITRVLVNDKTDKYKKLLESRHVLKFDISRIESDNINHSFIQ